MLKPLAHRKSVCVCVGAGGKTRFIPNVTFVNKTDRVSCGEQQNVPGSAPNRSSRLVFEYGKKIWEAAGGKWKLEFGGSVFCLGKVRQIQEAVAVESPCAEAEPVVVFRTSLLFTPTHWLLCRPSVLGYDWTKTERSTQAATHCPAHPQLFLPKHCQPHFSASCCRFVLHSVCWS